jgi:thioredoxin-like negative regulator of GroEL
MGKAQDVTDATCEQEVLRSAQPVLIDLWAPWCGPYMSIAPLLEELAGECERRLKVRNLDGDSAGLLVPEQARWPIQPMIGASGRSAQATRLC